jgi:hypothetical protein
LWGIARIPLPPASLRAGMGPRARGAAPAAGQPELPDTLGGQYPLAVTAAGPAAIWRARPARASG